MSITLQQRIGRYELQQLLGSGSIGEVWKGFDPRRKSDVAIKILHAELQADSDFITRFVKDGHALASLQHPHIVKIRDVTSTRPSKSQDTTTYMATDYIMGINLAEYIRETSRIGNFPDFAEIVSFFMRIGLAIDYAHQRGFIHGNLKPSNILLDGHTLLQPQLQFRHPSSLEEQPVRPLSSPVLTDFSAGKLKSAANSSDSKSACYISPEQAKGQKPTRQSDIYLLGIILYELFTGIQPFRGESAAAILMQQINTLPTPPLLINPDIPPDLSEVILRAMAKEPSTRYVSAAQLVTALAHACSIETLLDNTSIPVEEPAYQVESGPLQTILGVSQTTPAVLGNSGKVAASYNLAASSDESNTGITTGSLPTITAVMPALNTKKRRRQISRTYLVLAGCFLALILGSSLVTLLVISLRQTTASGTVVGHVYLQSDAFGQMDVLRIDMQNIPDPGPGKAYFAWLSGVSKTAPLLLGKLPVVQGQAHFVYKGHSHDLLAMLHGVLITEGDVQGRPAITPTTKQVFHVGLPVTAIPGDTKHLSVLDHLRSLLSGTQGSPLLYLERNTARTWLWAINARDYWNGDAANLQNTFFIRGQIVHIIDVLGGKLIDTRDAQVAHPGLLGQNPNGPAVLTTMLSQLDAIAHAPGATAYQQANARQTALVLKQVSKWLTQVQQDATRLFAMSDGQLASPRARPLLADMAYQANLAYNGQLDPATNQLQKGVSQIVIDLQHLATFDIATIA
jgi:serine/threonine protein kinase